MTWKTIAVLTVLWGFGASYAIAMCRGMRRDPKRIAEKCRKEGW